MILKRIKVRAMIDEPTNCYIVQDEISKETMVIDPGAEPDKIIEMLDVLSAKVKYIYLTHCHGDHIGAVYDAEGLYNDSISLCSYIGMEPPKELEADSRVDDGDLIHVGNLEFRIIHTPGHTKGGSSIYCKKENLLFSGDTIFRGTWGRTDLPTGSFTDILDSIMNKILILPDDTIIYPGHGKSTKIKEEKPIYYELHARRDM